jgi:pimeloyl-ACP methyl ester carboxylesterase
VFEIGSADASLPLMFVHGTAEFGACLAPLMARLHGVRIVGFDRPGYGSSDPFRYTQDNLIPTSMAVLLGVLDHFEIEQADVVGHSMGGHAALRFAEKHPERVRRIVLLGAVPSLPGTTPPLPLRLMVAPVVGWFVQHLQRSGDKGVLDIARIFGEREALLHHPALLRAIAAHEADPSSKAAGRSEFESLFSARGWRPSNRIGKTDLQRVPHPTTLVCGRHDPLGDPSGLRDAVDALPRGGIVPLDAGHLPYLRHAEQCAQVVQLAVP